MADIETSLVYAAQARPRTGTDFGAAVGPADSALVASGICICTKH
jgi:hypothetical protein